MGNIRISAVVLASGMSKRMGTVKQLLPYNGSSILECVIRKLLPFPFESIHAVIGNHHEEILGQIRIEDSRFNWVINEKFMEGQSAALKKAVKSLSDVDGMMVFLADQPLILPETIALVFNKAKEQLLQQEKKIAIQPCFSGRKGHPVFFSNNLFPLFEMLEGDEGGKRIIKQSFNYQKVVANDPGILIDIDTQEDYHKLVKGII
ncbi:nucleotidyltransferase family protein [Aneurinibacillus sp. Ricciae_BoGa-3]|uniref:nucleotidyltransferase family protein n=1 Tax=Aneurinibacillus sp. Ricciae_BoGa-3 TaxID=3022697 RepID=UPI002341CE21|nr:nucleotidyltransferase family protein [Aneurinibacillus sp. Ricciae_BoGa-3]WCK52348.1 nucleotidyltransferase family protein [Aneurinibacillus sp. Ricciae_BoGa-3]